MRAKVLDGGFVELVDKMGGDDSVVQAARVTSGTLSAEGRRPNGQLIDYLVRHGHSSPLEFCQLVFHVRAPIYVARQWRTHRTLSWNEVSQRYVEVNEDWQRQSAWRGQAKNNRQASDGAVKYKPDEFCSMYKGAPCSSSGPVEEAAFMEYRHRLEAGVAREQARTCLPLSTWTEWRFSVNLRNCLHFLGLRADPHAQEEIRAYAEAMVPMVESVAPLCVRAWKTYQREAVTLSTKDVQAMRMWPLGRFIAGDAVAWQSMVAHECGMTEGEMREHVEKRELLIAPRRAPKPEPREEGPQ